MMTPEELELIIDRALDKRSRIDVEAHQEHHEFVRTLIEREHRRQVLWDEVLKQILGWGAIAAIGVLGNNILTHIRLDTFFK